MSAARLWWVVIVTDTHTINHSAHLTEPEAWAALADATAGRDDDGVTEWTVEAGTAEGPWAYVAPRQRRP